MLDSLKVLLTKVTRTSDFALFEVKEGKDSIKLIKRIGNSLEFGINNRFSVKPKIDSVGYLIVYISSERVDNKSFVREVLKETEITLLLPH